MQEKVIKSVTVDVACGCEKPKNEIKTYLSIISISLNDSIIEGNRIMFVKE